MEPRIARAARTAGCALNDRCENRRWNPTVCPPGERACVYEYAGAGAQRLLAIVWDRETTALEGESVSTAVLEILPGR